MDSRFTELVQSVLSAKESAAELNALEVTTTNEQTVHSITSTSKVAVWRLWIYIFCKILFDQEKILTALVKTNRPQNIPNFQNVVYNFRDGLEHKWIDGKFQYDLTSVPDAEDRKIIKKASVFENDEDEIIVKIALENNVLATSEQIDRIKAYLKNEKPPGSTIVLINKLPDQIKTTLTVWVDTQIIDKVTGKLLNVSEEVYPVKDAIKSYLNKLEFNGAFVTDKFTSEIKTQPGIELVNVELIQWKYESFPFVDFSVFKKPESGHFEIKEENLTINYLDYALVNN